MNDAVKISSRRTFVVGGLALVAGLVGAPPGAAQPRKPSITVYRDPT